MHINRTLSQNQGTFFEKSGRYCSIFKERQGDPPVSCSPDKRYFNVNTACLNPAQYR